MIGIHGFPQLGAEPMDQLASIRLAFEQFPVLRDSFTVWSWSRPTHRNVGVILKLLETGGFGSRFAPELAKVLATTAPARRAIIGYSSGGSIFLRWLLSQPAHLEDLCAVVIAAPYQCQEGFIIFDAGATKVQITVNEPPLDPEEIAARLAPEQLLVLLAENDGTVLRHNAAFPQELVDQDKIIQIAVPGTDHYTVCHNTFAHQQILAHFRRRGIQF